MELVRMINAIGVPRPLIYVAGGVAAMGILALLSGMRYLPNNRIGIVENLWSLRGSVSEGRLMAFGGRAGNQTAVLRGGLHFLLWIWQYRIHRVPLTVVSQGRIGDVFARDGEPLKPEQTRGRVVRCNNLQNALLVAEKAGIRPSATPCATDQPAASNNVPEVEKTSC